jgi:hypothetical protein
MAQIAKNASDKVRAKAGFHADNARRQHFEGIS